MKRLCILLIVIASIAEQGYAQIVYVDVNPNYYTYVNCGIGGNDSSTWDLDGNGTNDFKIYAFSTGGNGGTGYGHIVGLVNNSIAVNGVGALSLNAGDTVNNQVSWASGSTVLIEQCSSMGYAGNWLLNHDNYLGIKFYAGSTLYYGWMHINTEASNCDADVVIKEYAYGTALVTASEGSTASIQEIKKQQAFSVYPNPAKDVLNIEFEMVNEKTDVTITDMLGNFIYYSTFTTQHNTINIADLSEGVYNISINSSEGVVNKRLIIVK